jgi:hypothetical protein
MSDNEYSVKPIISADYNLKKCHAQDLPRRTGLIVPMPVG